MTLGPSRMAHRFTELMVWSVQNQYLNYKFCQNIEIYMPGRARILLYMLLNHCWSTINIKQQARSSAMLLSATYFACIIRINDKFTSVCSETVRMSKINCLV